LKNLYRIVPLALSILTTAAHADSLLLGSYATGAMNPGVINTSTVYAPAESQVNKGVTTTYALNPGSTWHATLPTSTYVSYDPNTAPGGGTVAPNGDYIYRSSFTLTAAQVFGNIGTLTVLADDTVAIFLNNTLILAAATPKGAGNTYSMCSDTGPNCLTPTTFTFSGLTTGVNILTFDVKQVNLVDEGLDYSGAIVSAVPEPATLAFFSTGLLGTAGMVRRRFKG
jgi:hypothetical protein